MHWNRGRINDLSVGDITRLRKLSLDDLPWATKSSPWPMVGMFGLGLGMGVLVGMAAGAGPARGTVEQAAEWTRDRGQKVAQRVRRPSDEEAERLG